MLMTDYFTTAFPQAEVEGFVGIYLESVLETKTSYVATYILDMDKTSNCSVEGIIDYDYSIYVASGFGYVDIYGQGMIKTEFFLVESNDFNISSNKSFKIVAGMSGMKLVIHKFLNK